MDHGAPVGAGCYNDLVHLRYVGALAAMAACSPPPVGQPKAGPVRARIVVTERGQRGGHLVLLDEDGRRLADLTNMPPTATLDDGAAWSPDGRWIVFQSSRGRKTLGESSLWVVPAPPRPLAPPRRLTETASIDRDPAWTPDGTALIYASIPAGGKSFDLWRLDVSEYEGELVPGARRPLTRTPANELYPNVSPDGDVVVYQRATNADGSAIWRMTIDGAGQRPLTDGPADLTPRFSPDGMRIAFARGRMIHAKVATLVEGTPVDRVDTDLFIMPARGGTAAPVVAEPFSDQHRPVWSSDGRWLCATSIYRALKTGAAVLGSVVCAEPAAKRPVFHALHDPAFAETRLSVALAPQPLVGARLRADQAYGPALARALRDYMVTGEQKKAGGDGDSDGSARGN